MKETMGTSGIFCGVPANGANALACGVRGELKTILFGFARKGGIDHARFHQSPTLFGMNLQNPIQTRKCENYTARRHQGSAGKTGTCASGGEGDFGFVEGADALNEFLMCAWKGNAKGFRSK
jgi:hypothetical protein